MKPNPDYDPFLWQEDKGTMFLENLISDMAPFRHLFPARGINELGRMVGTGITRAGERGYLATPSCSWKECSGSALSSGVLPV